MWIRRSVSPPHRLVLKRFPGHAPSAMPTAIDAALRMALSRLLRFMGFSVHGPFLGAPRGVHTTSDARTVHRQAPAHCEPDGAGF